MSIFSDIYSCLWSREQCVKYLKEAEEKAMEIIYRYFKTFYKISLFILYVSQICVCI